MSPKQMATFRMAPELLEAMRDLKDRDGIPVSEQLDRAAREWLKTRGIDVKKKAERKRAATRKRS